MSNRELRFALYVYNQGWNLFQSYSNLPKRVSWRLWSVNHKWILFRISIMPKVVHLTIRTTNFLWSSSLHSSYMRKHLVRHSIVILLLNTHKLRSLEEMLNKCREQIYPPSGIAEFECYTFACPFLPIISISMKYSQLESSRFTSTDT